MTKRLTKVKTIVELLKLNNNWGLDMRCYLEYINMDYLVNYDY